jgi:hypothetical protein
MDLIQNGWMKSIWTSLWTDGWCVTIMDEFHSSIIIHVHMLSSMFVYICNTYMKVHNVSSLYFSFITKMNATLNPLCAFYENALLNDNPCF